MSFSSFSLGCKILVNITSKSSPLEIFLILMTDISVNVFHNLSKLAGIGALGLKQEHTQCSELILNILGRKGQPKSVIFSQSVQLV